jgi:hypothetical protein
MSNIKLYWHPDNLKNPDDYSPHSNKRLLWQCPIEKDHQWVTTVGKISIGGGCPFCAGRKIALSNCLAITHPEIAAEWHLSKNGVLTPYEVGLGQSKKVWWQCKNGHEWISPVTNRINRYLGIKSTCAYCLNQKISIENSLAYTDPALAKEWNHRNILKNTEVSRCCNKKVWWICKKNHEWFASVINRTKGRNCPYCGNRKLSLTNSLFAVNPNLCKEWHPTKNRLLLPDMVFPGAKRKVWWICEKGHEWEMRLYQRTGPRKVGCPVCNESKGESKITAWLKTKNIHFERQKTFKECKNKFVLRFDFLITDQNILVEYNGKQHYQPIAFFGGKEALLETQQNDKIKTDFCCKKDIKLIIISYLNFDKIEQILEKELTYE